MYYMYYIILCINTGRIICPDNTVTWRWCTCEPAVVTDSSPIYRTREPSMASPSANTPNTLPVATPPTMKTTLAAAADVQRLDIQSIQAMHEKVCGVLARIMAGMPADRKLCKSYYNTLCAHKQSCRIMYYTYYIILCIILYYVLSDPVYYLQRVGAARRPSSKVELGPVETARDLQQRAHHGDDAAHHPCPQQKVGFVLQPSSMALPSSGLTSTPSAESTRNTRL